MGESVCEFVKMCIYIFVKLSVCVCVSMLREREGGREKRRRRRGRKRERREGGGERGRGVREGERGRGRRMRGRREGNKRKKKASKSFQHLSSESFIISLFSLLGFFISFIFFEEFIFTVKDKEAGNCRPVNDLPGLSRGRQVGRW